MLTRGRVLGLLLVLLVLWGAYTAWLALQVRADLDDARAAAERFRASAEDLGADGRAARQERDDALVALQSAATSAREKTDDARWAPLTWLPVVGDDARAVEVLSGSLAEVSTEGIPPLLKLYDRMDGLLVDGGVDLDQVEALQRPVGRAADVFASSETELGAFEQGDLVGAVRDPFAEYAALVADGSDGLAAAERALRLAPPMLGSEGRRTYLLVFQNNAEIRGAGGLPGSWAALRATDGKLSLGLQGAGSDFPERATPILPLTEAERAIYQVQLGTYFVDATFTPDFPRAAELMAARWQEEVGIQADGVVSIDPVALSYLMEGADPVTVAGQSLTADNVVETLLNKPYLELDQVAQDAFFRAAAKAIFEQVIGDVASPSDFLAGAVRAAEERRLLVAPFDPEEVAALEGQSILGDIEGESGSSPHLDIGLDDATGSKMSYYLRHSVEVTSVSCEEGRQVLEGTVTLRQTIDPADAAGLPPSVTGGGNFGTPAGEQLVVVRIHGPDGAEFKALRINGTKIPKTSVDLEGRPVVSPFVNLDSTRPETVTFRLEAGPAQTGNTQVHVTPGIEPGTRDSVVPSAC